MKLAILLISWLLQCKVILSVVLTPNNPSTGDAAVELNNDPRGINQIVGNEWKVDQDNTNGGILFDWGLVATFSANQYGFKSGSTDSRLIVSLNGRCQKSPECDAYFAFSIGGNEYVIYVIDFDGGYRATLQPSGGQMGIFGIPSCSASSVSSGDVSILMGAAKGPYANQRIRDGLAPNGDSNNWGFITSNMNGNTFPVRFELINDDVGNTFTVNFESATTSFTCSYTSAVSTGKEIKMYFSPDDVSDEVIFVESIEVLSLDECGYEYVSDAKSYSDAEAYCLSTYGRHLAEIQTRQDRDCAIYKSGDGEAPWNGIHGVHSPQKKAFEYFDVNTLCPLNNAYCVDFWISYPRDCVNGNKCTVFYPQQDGINNDQNCDSQRAFLCNDEAATAREYVYYSTPKTWAEARTYCENVVGTSLATIITAADRANMMGLSYWTQAWIGLNDHDEEGVYKWIDGTLCALNTNLCTSYWYPNQPNNNGGADCGEWLFGSYGDVHNDDICSVKQGFVCNKPTA